MNEGLRLNYLIGARNLLIEGIREEKIITLKPGAVDVVVEEAHKRMLIYSKAISALDMVMVNGVDVERCLQHIRELRASVEYWRGQARDQNAELRETLREIMRLREEVRACGRRESKPAEHTGA